MVPVRWVAWPKPRRKCDGSSQISCRSGGFLPDTNYAYEVVRHLGIDEKTGVVRIGLAHYNTEEEVDATLTALEAALK